MVNIQYARYNFKFILANIPLSETIGYSTFLRSISKGEASFLMKFDKFDFVTG